MSRKKFQNNIAGISNITQFIQWDSIANAVSFSLEPNLDAFAAKILPDAKILDYGCGYGRITNLLYAKGYTQITGVDTSVEMIRRGLNEFPVLDLRQIKTFENPVELGKFDVILLCAVLTCIPLKAHRKKIITAAHEALKQGGIIYCIEFQTLYYDEFLKS
jgi:SAM-dependent methyltransferase